MTIAPLGEQGLHLNGVAASSLDDMIISPQGGLAPSGNGGASSMITKGQTVTYFKDHSRPANVSPDTGTFADWDDWTAKRVAAESVANAAAMKASGLTAPIPGLAEMDGQGTFFACAPYGTCWEPTNGWGGHDSSQPATPTTSTTAASSSSAASAAGCVSGPIRQPLRHPEDRGRGRRLSLLAEPHSPPYLQRSRDRSRHRTRHLPGNQPLRIQLGGVPYRNLDLPQPPLRLGGWNQEASSLPGPLGKIWGHQGLCA